MINTASNKLYDKLICFQKGENHGQNSNCFYTRLARGLAAQFGSNCEIVIHDLESNDVEHSIGSH